MGPPSAGLSAEEGQRLASAGWHSLREAFLLCDTQLRGVLGCDAARLREVRLALARQLAGPCRTALELARDSRERFLGSGLEELDRALEGGMRRGSLTELVGRAGCGKTQCCLQLTASCASRAQAVVYLDTENSYRTRRLVQLARARGWLEDGAETAFLERVFIWRPSSSDELLEALKDDGQVERTAIESGASLIVVDSVAALVRTDFSKAELRDRQAWLAAAAAALKRIARRANLAVVVTNHVMADLSSPVADSVAPALGLLWSHCVTTRLVLEPESFVEASSEDDLALRGAHSDTTTTATSTLRRPGRITIAKSPSVPEASVPYVIGTAGLVPPPRLP